MQPQPQLHIIQPLRKSPHNKWLIPKGFVLTRCQRQVRICMSSLPLHRACFPFSDQSLIEFQSNLTTCEASPAGETVKARAPASNREDVPQVMKDRIARRDLNRRHHQSVKWTTAPAQASDQAGQAMCGQIEQTRRNTRDGHKKNVNHVTAHGGQRVLRPV